MSKKASSMLLALVMVLGLLPVSAIADGTEQVYISVSYDGAYIDGVDAPIVYVPVSFDPIAYEKYFVLCTESPFSCCKIPETMIS